MRAQRQEVVHDNPNAHLWHVVAGIVALAVIVALGAASLAWTFAHRSSGSIAPQEIATIAAPDKPAKVPPVAREAPQPEQGATVRDGNASAPVGKVVTSEEQPVAPPSAKFSAEDTQVRRRRPRERRSQGTTPHAAKPAKVAAVEAPAAHDDAAAPAANEVMGGLFAVQFGAAGSKAEARDIMRKVASKYGSQIGGRRLGYHHVKVGDKSVYRVDVGGMSKEAAAAICEKVKSAGGNCFVTGN